MTPEELFDIIELDSPEEFEYFEQLAALLESEEDIPFDLFYTALSKVSGETLGEIIENYFEELSNGLPDSSNDMVSLIDGIQQRLLMLCESLENEDSRRDLAEELYKFRLWYNNPEYAEVDGKKCSVMDAVYTNRAEKMGGKTHSYDFPGETEYEQSELVMNLGSFEKIDVVKGEDE